MRKLFAAEVPTGVAATHEYERHAAPRAGIGSSAWLKVFSVHITSFVSMGVQWSLTKAIYSGVTAYL